MKMLLLLATIVAVAVSAPLNEKTKDFKCGQPSVAPKPCATKIVGGCPAVPYSWPWQVVLEAKGNP